MTEAMDLVSVIIPNYNHGAYLKQRIDTVLNQTYPHIEIIILDDCSTDDSRPIIESYRNHPQVSHVVYNEENTGSPFKQWINGIALATGKYIWIAESDDWCEPTLLHHLVAGMQQDENCAISYCQSYCVIDDRIDWQSSHPRLLETIAGPEFIKHYLAPNPAIFNASMAIWRKDNFDRIPLDFANYRFSGDWVFWIELAKTGSVSINGRLLNYFRKHAADVSSGAYKSGLNFVEGLAIINKLFREGLIDEQDYGKAYKKNFKEFWQIRHSLPVAVRRQILEVFKQPLVSKALYTKIWLSANWKAWRKR